MSKYIYDTEKEAQEVLDQARKEWKHFCPVIGRMCRDDCISYHEGSVCYYDGKWQIYYPWCSNVLISGEITVHPE